MNTTGPIPKLNWTPSPDVQRVAMVIGFSIIILWLMYALFKFAVPSQRFSAGRMFKPVQLVGVGILVVILMDLNVLVEITNGIASGANWLWNWVKGLQVG